MRTLRRTVATFLCVASFLFGLWGVPGHAEPPALAAGDGQQALPLNIVRAPGAVVIDGKLKDWIRTAPVSYEVDPNAFDQKAKTYAMWDDANLYLAYVVRDASPMKNVGNDPSAAFKSGDTLHFYLGTGSKVAASSAAGGPEDCHVLMTIQHGQPVVFAFRQQKVGVDSATTIRSPATAIDLAWMGPVPGAELAIATAGAVYTAEVKLPLAFFDGFQPQEGQRVAVDAAVNFSDPAGSRNIAKVWWHRGASQILDIPTELRFDRNQWGTGIFRGPRETPVVVDSADLFVVPAPGPMTVDGDLTDWDLSCAYGPMYVDPALKDKYNITWTLMYDAEALYLAAVFNSAQPFANDGGVNNVWWLGDSIEIRVAADPKNQGGDIRKNMDILTFALWYNQAEEKDYLALQRSFSFVISATEGAMVRSQATPGGRTFEARVPWAIVQSGNVPKAGDSIAITLAGIWQNGLRAYGMGSISSFRGMGDWGQAHFLAATPSLVYVNLHQSEEAAPPAEVKYRATIEIPEEGLLSAGVYRPDGTLLRTLLAGQATQAGQVELGWDGNGDDGQSAVPGTYEIRALVNAGLHARYVTSATSPGKPPHDSDNPLGGWGGVWDNVQDIAADATGIYPLWGVEEGDGLLIHADEDGTILWRAHVPLAQPGRQIGVACNSKYVYVLADAGDKTGGRAGLWRVRRSDGSYVPIPHDGSDPLAFDLEGITRPALSEEVFAASARPAGTSLAADATTVYVSAYYRNQVACYDAETCKPLRSFDVQEPMGVCLDGEDALLVVSGKQVVRLDLKSGLVQPVVSAGLVAPFDVAVDTTGRILVTDRGAAQQIKRFERTGTLQGSFGKPGGRDNNGKFEVDRLRNPAGIAVTASGNVFYSEDAEPKVFVRLSPDLEYEKLWCGPWYLSGEVCVDPANPDDLYSKGGDAFIRHKLDYATKSSRPDALWTDFALPGRAGDRWWTTHGRWFPRIVGNNGVKYMFCGGPVVSLFRLDGDRMTLVASMGVDRENNVWTERWVFNDLNDNGKVDAGERTVTPQDANSLKSFVPSYWGGSVDERDMSIYLLDGRGASVWALTPTFVKKGVPRYTFEDARVIPLAAARKPGQRSNLSSIWCAPDGGVFGNADANGSDPRGIGHSSHLSDVFVYRLDRDGKLLWRAGRKASGIAKNGEFYGRACGLGGPINGTYFDFVDENGQDTVYTFDGLFVGKLLDDSAVALPSENTLRVEHFNSIVYQNATDGKWYFVAGASGYASIWEIAGLDKITRLQTQVEVP